MLGVGVVERAQELPVGETLGPRHAQRGGLAPEALEVARVGRRHGAQDADLASQHEVGGAHPGEQRDLGVPVLRGEQRAEGDAEAALAVLLDLLLGHRQGGAAALALERDPLLPDLLEQHEALLRAAVVDRALHLLVVVAAHAAHHRAVDLDRGALAVGGEADVPDEGRPHLVGQQARGPLAELAGVQLHPLVGAVDRLAAASGLGVDRAAGRDEGRHVGDRVAHPVARAVALDRHRLVEVLRRRRVDGDEGHRRLVALAAGRRRRPRAAPRRAPRAGSSRAARTRGAPRRTGRAGPGRCRSAPSPGGTRCVAGACRSPYAPGPQRWGPGGAADRRRSSPPPRGRPTRHNGYARRAVRAPDTMPSRGHTVVGDRPCAQVSGHSSRARCSRSSCRWRGWSPRPRRPPSARVTGPAYDSPGSTVAVVVTTSSRPSGYALSFRVSVAGIAGVCNGSQWRHSTGWSQRCWVTLPSRLGTWTVSSRAVFTRTGYATQYSAYGYKSVATKGYYSAPVSAPRGRASRSAGTPRHGSS